MTGLNKATWSNSVNGYLPRLVVATSVVMARTGIELSLASTSPGSIYVAPPPEGPSQMPGLPVTRA